jgi:uncharacterized RDD family membrane protein YckC
MYDGFLLIAILFIVTGIATVLNDGKAIEPDDSYYPLFVTIVFILIYLYFAWFWAHGGQTLGMKTWRIRLVPVDGQEIGWKTSTIRFLAAIVSWGIFTIGYLWSLLDRKNHCWHDMISRTELRDLRNR